MLSLLCELLLCFHFFYFLTSSVGFNFVIIVLIIIKMYWFEWHCRENTSGILCTLHRVVCHRCWC